MIINAKLQSVEKGGFAMVAASYDQGDAAGDSHSGDPAFVGQIHCNPQRIRREKGSGILHGT